MSTDTIPSPAAWRLSTLIIQGIEDRDAVFTARIKIREFYRTAPNEELAAAYSGDWLEEFTGRRVITGKPSRFTTMFTVEPKAA